MRIWLVLLVVLAPAVASAAQGYAYASHANACQPLSIVGLEPFPECADVAQSGVAQDAGCIDAACAVTLGGRASGHGSSILPFRLEVDAFPAGQPDDAVTLCLAGPATGVLECAGQATLPLQVPAGGCAAFVVRASVSAGMLSHDTAYQMQACRAGNSTSLDVMAG